MTHEENIPHILPLKVYLIIGASLLILTAITVFVATQFHFGPFNLVVAMTIAAFKATLVALYFMHLRYDHKIYAAVFIGSLLFLAIFITLTMFDTMRRGDLYSEVARPIDEQAAMYKPGGSAAPVEEDDGVEFEVESDSADESWEFE